MKCLKLIVSTLAIALTSASAWAGVRDSINLNLSVSVPDICALSGVTADATETGSQLIITTSCNSPNYALNLIGAQPVNITAARSLDQQVRSVTPSGSMLNVTSQRPGQHRIMVDLNNSLAELSDLQIGILSR